jgi:hypothetical protein
MRFFLGTHMPSWLTKHELQDVPLFVSHRRLDRYRRFKPAITDWALDSGGFTELSMFGEWRTKPSQYIAAIRRYADQIGRLQWASPQDWMCEPEMLNKTGKTIEMHQWLTVNNYLELRWQAPDLPIIPVLQGWTLDDYLRHADMYQKIQVDLENEPIVGIGSICRRQHTEEAAQIAQSLQPLQLHAFGAKGDAIAKYGQLLSSCDSMAWSYAGRSRPDPSCPKTSCSNCLHYALAWRNRAINPKIPTLFGGIK